jgi:hypothetical protein
MYTLERKEEANSWFFHASFKTPMGAIRFTERALFVWISGDANDGASDNASDDGGQSSGQSQGWSFRS